MTTPQRPDDQAAPSSDPGSALLTEGVSTVDVSHHGTNDDDPTGAKAAGGLVNSEYEVPSADEGRAQSGTGALGASGGSSEMEIGQPAQQSGRLPD